MNIHLEILNDEELQCLVSNNIGLFLEPIKQNPKSYMKFNSALGTKNKKSILVQKNLPIIATKQFRRQDKNFVKAMEITAEQYANIFIEFINKIKGQNISTDEIKKYSNEEIVSVIQLYQSQQGKKLEYDLFWIQLKLVGISDIDGRKDDILLLCGIEKEKAPVKKLEQVDPKTKKASFSSYEKKNKPKKLTAEEKAAKTRAANEAKEKIKLSEQSIKNVNQDKDVMIEVADKKKQIALPIIIKGKSKDIRRNLKERQGMRRYIGVINIKIDFYNFTPIGYYENGNYTAYSENDLDELLPKSNKHNINFYYNYWDENHFKFMKEKFFDGQLILLNCGIDELEENRTPDGQLNATGYKIQTLEAWNRGKICPLSETGMYVVLHKGALLDDIATKRVVCLECEGLVEGEKVLVNLGEGFYAGPFLVKYLPTKDTF